MNFGTENLETVGRLVIACVCGATLGLNRDLHHKPAGLRTFSLVSLAAAMVVMAINGTISHDTSSVSRVMQGVLTGVGFLGAGVILHQDAKHVAGLTTSAAVLVAASMGLAAGLGAYVLAFGGLVLSLLILSLGGRFEHWFVRKSASNHLDSDSST
jgi:putative Mg2+ transporter-C (MgtC) family protein